MSESQADSQQIAEIHEAFRDLLGDASPGGMSAIAGLLDDLTHPIRTAVIRRFSRADQKGLYRRAEGFAPLSLADLVPPSRGDLEEVRHLGLNTLPAFRVFEKRFCRAAGEDREDPSALAGYNFQTMQPLTGPGYFVAVEDEATREVLVDYTRLPASTPADWPAVRSNEKGLSRFVYGFMVDRLRRVSEHVTIGSAARKGRELGSYFVLTREPGRQTGGQDG